MLKPADRGHLAQHDYSKSRISTVVNRDIGLYYRVE